MTYFADFSHYKYFPRLPANYLNIGWLSGAHPFLKGTVSDKFLSNLERLREKPVHLCLGLHDCEFCIMPDDIIGAEQEHSYRYKHKLLGNGELHVPGENGLIYVAPALIYHYVTEHQYQPSVEFIKAVEKYY